jgi:hypothetical protein
VEEEEEVGEPHGGAQVVEHVAGAVGESRAPRQRRPLFRLIPPPAAVVDAAAAAAVDIDVDAAAAAVVRGFATLRHGGIWLEILVPIIQSPTANGQQ